MKLGILMKVLWRRHWWEVCLFLLASLSLSGLIVTGEEYRFTSALVWIEVAGVVWLVVRVSLTDSEFGTFGGSRARPIRRLWYVVAELILLVVVIALAVTVRMFAVGEVLQPSREGWREVMEDGIGVVIGLAVIFVICRFAGLTLISKESKKRTNFGWGLVVAVTGLSLLSEHGFKWERGGSAGTSHYTLNPLIFEGVEDWQWLRTSDSYYGEFDEDKIHKLPLKTGSILEIEGMRFEITEIEIAGTEMKVLWEGERMENFGQKFPKEFGVMISYGRRYFGTKMVARSENNHRRLPLLNDRRAKYSALIYSPLALPENEQSAEDLLADAELWLAFGRPQGLKRQSFRYVEEPQTVEEAFRWAFSGSRQKKKFVATVAELNKSGREAMEDVLAVEPWSGESWEKVVRPYLVKFAEEGDLPRLLDLLDLNPWMADLFFEKDWTKEAELVLREHLRDGKTLSKRAVIYLAEVGEEEMGDDLVNQLLRMDGDFDAVAAAMRGHPGVSWDEVRREAWQRAVTGFGNHHVWVQWGVEIGEKEALRRFLVEAIRGKKWEREMLEGWFGKNEDVVEMLRENWERVVFRDGKWVVDTELGL